jgi:hypothetical protein
MRDLLQLLPKSPGVLSLATFTPAKLAKHFPGNGALDAASALFGIGAGVV